LILFISFTSTHAQDYETPWQFTFGTNAVDLDSNTQTELKDFFNINEKWNVASALSMFSLSKYLGDNFSLGLCGSLNSISNFDGNYTFRNSVKYFAGDIILKYSLSELLNTNKMEPFVGVGLGNTWMDDLSWATTNASVGMSYWISDSWGLTSQVDFKTNLGVDGRGNTLMLDGGGTLRYSFGFSVKFGGINKN
jgi:outer membrane protein W